MHDDIRLRAIYEEPPHLSDRESDLCFHSLVPIPDEVLKLPYDSSQARQIAELLDLPEKDMSMGGYGWETNNWGVKWGACEVMLDHNDPESVSYRFDTPWGPPTEFLEKVAEDWPSLRFEMSYEEFGMGFAGEMVFEEGTLIHESNREIEDDYEEEE